LQPLPSHGGCALKVPAHRLAEKDMEEEVLVERMLAAEERVRCGAARWGAP